VEDLTDNEREEQVRRFIRENLLYLLLAVALGIGGVAGYKYWQSRQLGGAESAKDEYEAVLESLSAGQPDQAAERSRALRAAYAKSPYADQAELALARAAVARRDYDAASQRLRAVIDGAGDPLLRQIARTRLARVMIEQGRHDDAIALLQVEQAGAFSALYHEIRGDAFAAKGDAAEARKEYTAALSVDDEQTGIDSAFVALKRDALPAAAGDAS
jgi:predicted negative regulator of RcsB-dependent stress response